MNTGSRYCFILRYSQLHYPKNRSWREWKPFETVKVLKIWTTNLGLYSGTHIKINSLKNTRDVFKVVFYNTFTVSFVLSLSKHGRISFSLPFGEHSKSRSPFDWAQGERDLECSTAIFRITL